MIPAHLIIGTPTARRGLTGAIDTVRVRHVSGGVSVVGFKSYDQGRKQVPGHQEARRLARRGAARGRLRRVHDPPHHGNGLHALHLHPLRASPRCRCASCPSWRRSSTRCPSTRAPDTVTATIPTHRCLVCGGYAVSGMPCRTPCMGARSSPRPPPRPWTTPCLTLSTRRVLAAELLRLRQERQRLEENRDAAQRNLTSATMQITDATCASHCSSTWAASRARRAGHRPDRPDAAAGAGEGSGRPFRLLRRRITRTSTTRSPPASRMPSTGWA